ncbi:MAG: hypothetical protein SGJ19_27365 [Planctomycetia bacterium]|nr:hypothetical protein [Planctomycetia bacterium]
MKPKFSILTLLGITAYVAVNSSAFLYPMSAWVPAAFWLSVAIMAGWAVVAAQLTTPRTVFARGALLFSLIYATSVIRTDGENGIVKMPHDYMLDALNWFHGDILAEGMADYGSTSEGVPSFYYARVKRSNLTSVARYEVALMAGVVGGSLALWHYQRKERRANQEKSGE